MTFDRRKYAREYAQRQRDKAVAAKNRGRERCQKRHGQGKCGALLEYPTDVAGIVVVCPACERQRRGICRDCDNPVEGRIGTALYCATCKPIAHNRKIAEWGKRHAARKREAARKRYQSNEAARLADCEYKRAWRKANRDKVRAQKRREALRQSARGTEYHRARREREREQLAQRELNRYHGIVAVRTCLTCDTVVRGRVKKCVMCKAREAVIAKDHPSLGRGKGWRGVKVAA